eukprot:12109091-Ditylum_brightwellii.AAC.1
MNKCCGDTTMKEGKDTVHIHRKHDKDKDPGLYGDLMIRHLWKRQTDCILNIHITDTDAKSYISSSVESVLAAQEKEKKDKYIQACLEQRHHFSPFVVSADGMLGHEASMVFKQISRKLAEKWDCSRSYAANYVKTAMSLSIVRATHCCLRGSRVPSSSMSTHRSRYEDGAGIGLLQLAQV